MYLKIYTLVFFLFFSLSYGQKKTTLSEAENTTDPRVIAKFLKENPEHPKTADLKGKIVKLVTSGNDKEAKPKVEPLTANKLEKQLQKDVRKEGRTGENQETAKVLNHLFNNDKNKNEAYLQIVNQSKCNLILKIEGKDFYHLDVPAKGQNFVMVKKGNYILTSKVCDAKYSSTKTISNDLSISLNAR